MDNFKVAQRAYYRYIGNEENIESDILKYLKGRIIAEKEEIQKLMKITKERLDIDKILELFDVKEMYKSSKSITFINDFAKGILITPKGVILKHETDATQVIGYYISAINTRNALIIVDKNYLEISVKEFVLEIFHEAMKKFDIDTGLIQLLSRAEVEGVYSLEENKKDFVYFEDEKYNLEENAGCIKLYGEIDEVIEKINVQGIANCAVIYTSDKDKAYKFLNRVNAKNVFVNAGIVNASSAEVDEWCINKNVIYPMK